jgi:hypothetical protein
VAVPRLLGEGEVRLYDSQKVGLPDVPKPPPEKELAEASWVLVHFPSRRCVIVPEGRLEAFRVMKQLERGKDLLKLLPEKKKPSRACAPTRAGASAKGQKAEESEAEGEAVPPQRKTLEVPVVPGLNFDAAMKHAFPSEFIITEIARLLRAEKAIYDREGGLVGYVDDYMTQTNAVKLMIEHAQGRAGEKPPPPPDKKRISFDELVSQIKTSPAARNFIRRILDDAEAETAVAPVVAPVEGSAATPAGGQ